MAKGGQLGNKNAEKWTEEKALDVARGMIEWMNDDDNIFYYKYLLANNLYKDVINYLCEKYSSFSDLIKKAQHIQETKLIDMGVRDKLQATMTIFVLKNHHGYKDKQEVDHTTAGKPITPIIKFTGDD